jgi:hypothetical protein
MSGTRLRTAGQQQHAEALGLVARLKHARRWLDKVLAPTWRDQLAGTLGADPALVL